ncbi:AP2 domain-containing protein [Massilia sp. PDC64]|nr:HNH endonuclease signature motif containing protein [Massilia sp. PDC64]SDC67314.1 AP2 domain-containing protein [Massilia sp. PDC64]SDC70357.1 AP2 domain-containing protein [Massilia sp. PDC64]
MVTMRQIPVERLRELLGYDPESGVLTWRVSRPKYGCAVGQRAGWIEPKGYVHVSIDQVKLKGHRVAWALHYGAWPAGNLDHVNGVRSDNRIANLRIADQHQNIANSPIRVNNKCGVKGVVRTEDGKWQAQITVRGKRHHLGRFKTKEAAGQAYEAAAEKHFGEFARKQRNP